jgi:hypothetical protein
VTDPIIYTSGTNLTIDAGLVKLPYGSIGDFVWYDLNGNGIQEPGEPGASGVAVELDTAAGDYVASTTTDDYGHYVFTDVAPGDYVVKFTRPPDYSFSPPDQGTDDAIDSDAGPTGVTAPFSLVMSETKTTVDAGLVLTGASAGDYVWYDANRDGYQDPSEQGLEGIDVHIYTQGGDLVATTQTDEAGHYKIDDLPPGNYYIVVDPPAGYAFTVEHATLDGLDSDVDATGHSAVFSLAAGDVRTDLDAGIIGARIAGKMWYDGNHDGVQQIPPEALLIGIRVTLLDANLNVVDSMVSTTGTYAFDGLPAGTYTVEFGPGPDPYIFTLQNVGDDALDSDPDPVTGLTDPIVVAAGQVNDTTDAGYWPVPDGGGDPGHGGGPLMPQFMLISVPLPELPAPPAGDTPTDSVLRRPADSSPPEFLGQTTTAAATVPNKTTDSTAPVESWPVGDLQLMTVDQFAGVLAASEEFPPDGVRVA